MLGVELFRGQCAAGEFEGNIPMRIDRRSLAAPSWPGAFLVAMPVRRRIPRMPLWIETVVV